MSAGGKSVSAYRLAELTGHSPVSVYQALERLQIKPISQIGHRKGYDPEVAKVLKKKMRKPRRSQS